MFTAKKVCVFGLEQICLLGIPTTNQSHQPSIHMGGEVGDTKHLVLVKFKEDTVVEDLMNDMGSLVSDLDIVKSFEW